MSQTVKRQKNKKTTRLFGDFDATVQQLKCKLPLKYPVTVKRISGLADAGDCSLHNKHFYIRINSELSWDASILILIHEFAHCLSFRVRENVKEAHGDRWGKAYALVYRAWLGI